ncbi:MAG: putative Rossmann-fold nucleotide-binding protein, partial [Saprospiraceae bacterium]
GYYDKLFDFMKHMVNEGFLKQFHVDKLILESNPAKLINKIQNYKSKNETKWL